MSCQPIHEGISAGCSPARDYTVNFLTNEMYRFYLVDSLLPGRPIWGVTMETENTITYHRLSLLPNGEPYGVEASYGNVPDNHTALKSEMDPEQYIPISDMREAFAVQKELKEAKKKVEKVMSDD